MFTKGAKIEITRKAHPYSHMGIIDQSHIVPEAVQIMRVRLTRQTKNGLKVHFEAIDGIGGGYAIHVENAPLFSFRAV